MIMFYMISLALLYTYSAVGFFELGKSLVLFDPCDKS